MSEPLKTIFAYKTKQGKEPFTDWFSKLRNHTAKALIFARLKRLAEGHYVDCKSVGDGVKELRIFTGPGYRVYFGEDKNDVILLLIGGDKATQTKDIAKANELWKEYNHG
jgi:putative addiction module killer protein